MSLALPLYRGGLAAGALNFLEHFFYQSCFIEGFVIDAILGKL
jgi:hypothetical protein